MKFLFIALLLLIAAVGLALQVLKDPGYVLVTYGDWSVETSLAMGGLLLLLAFALIYYLIRLTSGVRRLPWRMNEWNRQRLAVRARKSLSRGLVLLAEGHWEKAEKALQKAEHSDTPLLNFLAAARAAQHQGADERRDEYLRRAHGSMSNVDVAVGLTQAELQIAHHQYEQALATLNHLRALAPRHSFVLKMLMRLYLELRDWDRLHELLPELRKRGVAANEELDEIEARVYAALLEQDARAGDLTRLQLNWNRMPKKFRERESLIAEYARQLTALQANAAAEPVIRDALKHFWNEELVHLYGLVHGADVDRQLASAEAWLKQHPKSPMMLLTLGRLARRNRLWGKARAYLDASLGLLPARETFQELGALLEQLKETDAALECYRKGMQLSVEAGLPALGTPKPSQIRSAVEVTPVLQAPE